MGVSGKVKMIQPVQLEMKEVQKLPKTAKVQREYNNLDSGNYQHVCSKFITV